MTKLDRLYSLSILLTLAVSIARVMAEENKSTDANLSTPTPTPPPYQVKVVSPGMAEMGRPILLGIYGDLASELSDALRKEPDTVRKNLKLYLNGVLLENLVPVILPPEAAEALKPGDPKPTWVLQFPLDRDSNDDANRKSWSTLLPLLQFGPQALQAGVALDGEVPHLTPKKDLQFRVRDPNQIRAVVVGGLILLVASMIAVIGTGMVREGGPGTPYSLGKTQMAFWGLLVAISFLGVWLIEYRMERIPAQVLTLMGISGVTGLGSVMINRKPAPAGAPGPAVAAPPHSWKMWFLDIISDGDGVSFHRFQVVIWTLILGSVFAWTVANTCAMPEFENTLLVLMGISNGLYLGFKIPETPK